MRRADGVALEAPTAIPAARARAEASGVVSLREPIGAEAVADAVEAFVDAWRNESLDALVLLLTTDAGPIEARSRGRGPLVDAWRQRLAGHAYGHLSGVEVLRRDRIGHWQAEDPEALEGPPGLRGPILEASPRIRGQGPQAPDLPSDLRAGEVYVRAPVEVTQLGGEKLFGSVLVFVLRREDGRLRIAAYGESDARR